MKNSTKLLLGAVSLAGVFATTAAFADDAPAFSLTGAITVQSDYKFRGISQNDRTPSPQGALTLSGPEGFYVATWGDAHEIQTAAQAARIVQKGKVALFQLIGCSDRHGAK